MSLCSYEEEVALTIRCVLSRAQLPASSCVIDLMQNVPRIVMLEQFSTTASGAASGKCQTQLIVPAEPTRRQGMEMAGKSPDQIPLYALPVYALMQEHGSPIRLGRFAVSGTRSAPANSAMTADCI